MTTPDSTAAPASADPGASPYLQRYRGGLVDWHGWGSPAIERARTLDRPILLLVGHSSSHACRAFERDWLADPATAATLNSQCVNVVVDAGQRPDIDRCYQAASELLTRQAGGWPLLLFLSPDDLLPFFGGARLASAPRQGQPGFGDLVTRVAQYYRERRAELAAQNAVLRSSLATLNPPAAGPDAALDDRVRRASRQALEQQFDRRAGGFGPPPRHPYPATLERLLRDWRRTATEVEPDLHALFMVALTLTRIAHSGLRDLAGGGFFHHALDADWRRPRFEQRLADNGALLAAYAQAAVATGDPLFARVTGEVADWLLRDLQSASGAFFAGMQADAAGVEGAHVLWSAAELREALGDTAAEDYPLLAARYGLAAGTATAGERRHLHAELPTEDVAAALGLDPATVARRLDRAIGALRRSAARRPRPATDTQIAPADNALAIRGLAMASRALQRPELAEAAARALDDVRARRWRSGRLQAATLDDHAFLADASLELAQSSWRSADLQFARALLEALLQRFEDADGGGFFFTAGDDETLIHRPKAFADAAAPAGNGVAVRALARTGWLLDEPQLLQAAERALRAAWPSMQRYPVAHASMIGALEEWQQPPAIVVLRGDPALVAGWRAELDRLYAPARMIFAIPRDAADLPPALAALVPTGPVTAYLRRGSQVSGPIESIERLALELRLGLGGEPGPQPRGE